MYLKSVCVCFSCLLISSVLFSVVFSVLPYVSLLFVLPLLSLSLAIADVCSLGGGDGDG